MRRTPELLYAAQGEKGKVHAKFKSQRKTICGLGGVNVSPGEFVLNNRANCTICNRRTRWMLAHDLLMA